MKKLNGLTGGVHTDRGTGAQPGVGQGVVSVALIRDLMGAAFADVGHALERKDKPEEALVLFQKAVEMTPDDARAWYNLGDTLLTLHRYREARECLEKAIALGGRGWLLQYDLGLTLYGLGECDQAAKLFQDLSERDGWKNRALASPALSVMTNLSLCYGELGRWKDAIATLHPALKSTADTLYNLGRFSLRAGDHAQARRLLAMAVELQPESEDAVHGLAAACTKAKDWDSAETCLRRATRLAPGCADAWYDLGVTYAQRRKPALRRTARRCFERALKVNPQHAWAHYDLACLDALERRPDSAFERLNRAIDLGLNAREHVLRDQDLRSLKRDPRWQEVRKRLSGTSGT